jgi:hypothetical protein
MANPWGRLNAPMQQPSKAELWRRIAELEQELEANRPPDLFALLGLERPKPARFPRRI